MSGWRQRAVAGATAVADRGRRLAAASPLRPCCTAAFRAQATALPPAALSLTQAPLSMEAAAESVFPLLALPNDLIDRIADFLSRADR